MRDGRYGPEIRLNDYAAGKRHGLAFLQPVDLRGLVSRGHAARRRDCS